MVDTKSVTIKDERFHGGQATVEIKGDTLHISSTAGYQTLPLTSVPFELLEKIREELKK